MQVIENSTQRISQVQQQCDIRGALVVKMVVLLVLNITVFSLTQRLISIVSLIWDGASHACGMHSAVVKRM